MAEVKVKYFGKLRELIGTKEERYEVNDATLADLLLDYIPSRHSNVAEEYKKIILEKNEINIGVGGNKRFINRDYLVLVCGKSVDPTYKLRDGDEVAILPPVGGGSTSEG